MINNLYPKSPQNVPADLVNPSKSYKKHVWIASIALIVFMLLYIGLTCWFLYKSFSLFANVFSGDRDGFASFITAVLTGFLGVFMAKALFFITRRDKSEDFEIYPDQEPELFEFIYKVADEAKAPRPHRVFISNVVNACVFYDVSIFNLFFPTKKNLEIGLGLVNTLNLGEFKAILAHEFGHFAQKSMIIGRWVYIAHQVAYQIVAKRDGFDSFLSGLSRLDLRIAWVGWVLSIIVWSLRAVSETFFKLVLLTQRALSREMEFHADLVAVSLAGSDALVHSLYKLPAADEAYDEAIEFANKQLKKKKAIRDVFAIQSNAIRHMAVVLNNPAYGASPDLSGKDGSKVKIFKDQMAQPPKMWSTHPSNIDREKNAKAFYIRSEVDNRSTWSLFKQADLWKEKLTKRLYKEAKVEGEPLTVSESLALQDKLFERSFLLPKYRGVYLKRDTMLPFKSIQNLYHTSQDTAELSGRLEELYPESLQAQLEHLKNLEEELTMLEGLDKKEMDAHEGRIHYRNREISRKEIPGAIEETKKELKDLNEQITAHDALCRRVHYAIAGQAGNGWSSYLWSLSTLVHYAEHQQKKIVTGLEAFYKNLAVATRIRNISDSEMRPLLHAANTLHDTLQAVFSTASNIKLSPVMVEALDGKQYSDLFEPFKLGMATRDNINSWIGVVDSWTGLALSALNSLKEVALDELLHAEETVASYANSPGTAPLAPSPVGVPENYTAYSPGSTPQVMESSDLFSKFYYADGLFATIGRLAVAAAIILFTVIFSASLGKTKLVIYNGLPVDVMVEVGGQSVPVAHQQTANLELSGSGSVQVETKTLDGKPVERFTETLPDNSKTLVYNVAQAAVIIQWTVYYSTYSFPGANSDSHTIVLGAPRWLEASVDYCFEEPPQSISMKSGESSSRLVMQAYTDHPVQMASALTKREELEKFLTAHALWEKSDSPNFNTWMGMMLQMESAESVINARLAANPLETATLRIQQELYKDSKKTEICEQQYQLYLKNPDNHDLYYLHCRCMPDGPQQDSMFVAGYKQWPDNGWLAYASSYVFFARGEWRMGIKCCEDISKNAPALIEGVLDESKRVCHLLKEDELYTHLSSTETPHLAYIRTIENSSANSKDGALYAYKLLAQGKLQEAIDLATSDSSLQAAIIRLAAVSDGADDDLRNRALALSPTAGLSMSTIIPSIALALKLNKPIDTLVKQLETNGNGHQEAFLQFIKHIEHGKIAEADRLIQKLSPSEKGQACLLGILLYGKRVPEIWNLYASTLLFISEKPYRVNELTDWDASRL